MNLSFEITLELTSTTFGHRSAQKWDKPWVVETWHTLSCFFKDCSTIGPLNDPVTWYGINYAGTQITQWDFQNKGAFTSPARLPFVLKVPLHYLRPSIIHSAPGDRIAQKAYTIQLFRQKLSHKSVKADAIMSIGITGSKSLVLLDWGSRWFSNTERESRNSCVCALSFNHAETPWGSIEQP